MLSDLRSSHIGALQICFNINELLIVGKDPQ